MGGSSLLEPLRAAPRRAGVFLDFDGTLAPIVDDPASAVLLDGVGDVLRDLAATYKVVAVLSGRPVEFLESAIPSGVVLCGLYGLEVVRDGRRVDHPQSGAWREVIDDVTAQSRARGPAGMHVEPKGLSLTLHYRTRPELADDVRRWAEGQASRSGLRVRAARMSVELHPPIEADKGTAVDQLTRGLAAVCFVGDDLGDLPAFAALAGLAERGVTAVRVAVASEESPPSLLDEADLTVEGPEGVLGLLRDLRP